MLAPFVLAGGSLNVKKRNRDDVPGNCVVTRCSLTELGEPRLWLAGLNDQHMTN